jgi:putative ABC transport system ATP-binding protein
MTRAMALPPDILKKPPVLEVRGLVHRWQKNAPPLFQVSELTLHAGESLFIHGPSGCGKSTLLSLICGVSGASEGAVCVQGQDWRLMSASRRDAWRGDHIGYIFQQFNLLPYLSPLDNAMLPGQFSRARKQALDGNAGVRQEAENLLKRMGLQGNTLHRASQQLSVGQQQRVAAARALLGAPALVVADEPTSALDEASREAFMQTLLQACTDAGSAVVFVSHDLRLATHFKRSLAWCELMEQGA